MPVERSSTASPGKLGGVGACTAWTRLFACPPTVDVYAPSVEHQTVALHSALQTQALTLVPRIRSLGGQSAADLPCARAGCSHPRSCSQSCLYRQKSSPTAGEGLDCQRRLMRQPLDKDPRLYWGLFDCGDADGRAYYGVECVSQFVSQLRNTVVCMNAKALERVSLDSMARVGKQLPDAKPQTRLAHKSCGRPKEVATVTYRVSQSRKAVPKPLYGLPAS